jgi:hypothetical protein
MNDDGYERNEESSHAHKNIDFEPSLRHRQKGYRARQQEDRLRFYHRHTHLALRYEPCLDPIATKQQPYLVSVESPATLSKRLTIALPAGSDIGPPSWTARMKERQNRIV